MNIKFLSGFIVLAAVFLVISPASADSSGAEEITIAAQGDGSYVLDDRVILSGTNTNSDYTYLFLTGPNLDQEGSILTNPYKAAVTGNDKTFTKVEVNDDGTWEYWFDTEGIGIDAGTYTIYAVTEPKNKADLSGGVFDTVSIAMKRRGSVSNTETTPTATEVMDSPITVDVLGDGSYFKDEEVTFSGVNTDSAYTYLFISGPGLNANGNKLSDLAIPSVTGDENTFAKAAVNADGKWRYSLDLNGMDFNPGTYTVYVVSEPKNKADLSGGTYDTASIVIKQPFITAKVSPADITQGEKITITGEAYGEPSSVAVWVLGFDYWNGAGTDSAVTVTPNADGSFSYVIGEDVTANMDPGEYFIVVEHPMYNDVLDVVAKPASAGDGTIVTRVGTPELSSETDFYIGGNHALRGADAAEALVDAINAPDIDDTYEYLTFNVEERSGGSSPNQDSGILAAFGNFLAGLFGQ